MVRQAQRVPTGTKGVRDVYADARGRLSAWACAAPAGKTMSYFSPSNFNTRCTPASLLDAQNSRAAVELTKSAASELSDVHESVSL